MTDRWKDMEETVPTLTLDPFGEEKAAVVLKEEKQVLVEEVIQKANLTEAERKVVDDFAKKIDLTNSNAIMMYGAGAQKKLADFSESALENVKNQDLGEIGDMLTQVVCELKSFDAEEEEKGFFGIFKKASNKVTTMKAKYAKAEANVDKIVEVLEGHQMRLMKDTALLDKMYETNLAYFKELTMYILAGKQKLYEARTVDLVKLREKAMASGFPEDAQAAKDMESMCNRFEKKLHDLELTRQISLQTAPQIRLVQSNDTMMAEKIQTTVVNTIPLWKSQMVIALGVAHSTEAAKAQREVTDMTNQLLRKNAEALHMASVETARESERGIVDLETLKATNASLIKTFDEVMQIQRDGHARRMAAEAELESMENELKKKLLELRG